MLQRKQSHFQQELAVIVSTLREKKKKKSTEHPPSLPKAHPLSPVSREGSVPLFSSLWATGLARSQR